MGASVHITLRGGLELAEATMHTTKHDELAALQHAYAAWEIDRRCCSSLDFAQDRAASRRWATNEDSAIDLLRRLADYHGW